MDAFEALRRDVDLLGRALGRAIRQHSGERLFELEEEVRALTKALRHAPDAATAARLEGIVRGISNAEAEGLARAFASYFHLVNLAEERHRVRVNRLREESSSPDAPRSESFLGLVKALRDRGLDAAQAEQLLRSLRLELTFTAHPTESRRLTVRHHLATVRRQLDELAAGTTRLDALDATVSLLWTTEEVHRIRPTVQDEVKNGLGFLPTTLWEALPRVAQELDDAFEATWGRRPGFDAPVLFRSWIGGDRDGNPNVTPEVTAWAQSWARELVLRRSIEDLDALIRDLSSADDRVPVPQDLVDAADASARAFELPHQFEGEPFRRYLMGLRARLRVLLGEREGQGYADDAAWLADVRRIGETLERSGLAAVARNVAAPVRVRAASYGLSLARLDLREESSSLEAAVAELLEVGGVTSTYAALSVPDKEALLTRELATARPLAPVGWAPRTKQLATALGSLRAWSARGAHVVSMTRDATDLLEVFVLAREAGFFRPGEALPFDVTPLFETLADLEHAPSVVTDLLRNGVFRAHVDRRGGMEVMIGYSDSNKDAGFLSASWALARAQERIAAAARAEGVEVSFFHGRGTSTARGGGPAGRAIASLPVGTVGTRMRLTEQGEALSDRYAHADLAVRNLEQLLFHFATAAARDTLHERATPAPAEWHEAMDESSSRSSAVYRALLARPGFFDFFEQITPIREIASLKIASRPVYRHGRVRDVKDLRAIPWVMAWTQVRANVPGWFGLGTGLAPIPLALRRRLYREWPLFRSMLDGAAMSLAKGDLRITAIYRRLVEPRLADDFLGVLGAEWDLTLGLLEETTEAPLIASSPTLRRSIDLRNPYVDPINHVQVELLARWRSLPEDHEDRPRTERALLATLLGIAAGVRNVG